MSYKNGAPSAAAAVVIALIFSGTSLSISPFGLYLKPVSDEFHWSLAVFPQGVLAVSLLYALTAPLAGRAADRLDSRGVVFAGAVLTSLSLFAFSWMSGALWRMYACAILVGIACSLVSPATLSGVIAGWYDKGRALVMGATLGIHSVIREAANREPVIPL